MAWKFIFPGRVPVSLLKKAVCAPLVVAGIAIIWAGGAIAQEGWAAPNGESDCDFFARVNSYSKEQAEGLTEAEKMRLGNIFHGKFDQSASSSGTREGEEPKIMAVVGDFRSALRAGDVDAAVKFIIPDNREEYRRGFSQNINGMAELAAVLEGASVISVNPNATMATMGIGAADQTFHFSMVFVGFCGGWLIDRI